MTTPNTPEAPPTPNARRPVWELVVEDMKERDHVGRAKYGTPLQACNGRDPLVDAYQEALDLAVYLRTAIEERKITEALMRRTARVLEEAADVCEGEGIGPDCRAIAVDVIALMDSMGVRRGVDEWAEMAFGPGAVRRIVRTAGGIPITATVDAVAGGAITPMPPAVTEPHTEPVGVGQACGVIGCKVCPQDRRIWAESVGDGTFTVNR